MLNSKKSLIPPDNFNLVENGLYRCSKIDQINFFFLKTLNLKSIILLNVEKPSRIFRNFLDENNIKLYQLGNLKFINPNIQNNSNNLNNLQTEHDNIEYIYQDNNKDDWMIINKNLIIKIFEILLNKLTYNLLLIDSTEILIGLLRKLLKWSYSSILAEYRLYSNKISISNYFAEIFLEIIRIELIPNNDHNKNNPKPKNIHNNIINNINNINNANNNKNINKNIPIQSNINSNNKNHNTNNDNENENENENEKENDFSKSPQIPQNLLKLVENRKKRKKKTKSISYYNVNKNHISNNFNNNNDNNDNDNNKSLLTDKLSKITLDDNNTNNNINIKNININNNNIDLNNPFLKSEPTLSITLPLNLPKNLQNDKDISLKDSTSALSSVSVLSSFTIPISQVSNYHDSNNILNKITINNTINSHNHNDNSYNTNAIKHYHFYKPNEKNCFKVKTLRIKLPREEILPNWFKFQRDLWEEEYALSKAHAKPSSTK
ncbi:Oca4p ASCRUDRAFT_68583 [Ascoidea rubescens DSM 1968]|uniref:Uncharacterized protein n=1 Tax=Ascoidea rubescens DSM 1968 TaxID=1344418 RepID=A0A1D2VMB9_9ASCO|nr:hypothetical protein ASCRUDRAFT_68583 [Ascoidea rubescens DSM 1968]ODV62749.1 hypothetical protein ASCRUDRAFT_68583 [Ascoidea rubescens DSM 1968]